MDCYVLVAAEADAPEVTVMFADGVPSVRRSRLSTLIWGYLWMSRLGSDLSRMVIRRRCAGIASIRAGTARSCSGYRRERVHSSTPPPGTGTCSALRMPPPEAIS